jgi:hypothetical protein
LVDDDGDVVAGSVSEEVDPVVAEVSKPVAKACVVEEVKGFSPELLELRGDELIDATAIEGVDNGCSDDA